MYVHRQHGTSLGAQKLKIVVERELKPCGANARLMSYSRPMLAAILCVLVPLLTQTLCIPHAIDAASSANRAIQRCYDWARDSKPKTFQFVQKWTVPEFSEWYKKACAWTKSPDSCVEYRVQVVDTTNAVRDRKESYGKREVIRMGGHYGQLVAIKKFKVGQQAVYDGVTGLLRRMLSHGQYTRLYAGFIKQK